MKILSKTVQILAMGLLSAVFLSGCAASKNKSTEKSVDVSKMKRSGSLIFKSKAYNLIVGGTWGTGVLTYKGKRYNFKAKSIGVGYAVGVKDVDVKGIVYNLKNVNDFAGTYWGVKAAGTLFVGTGAASISNSKDVVLNVTGASKGAAVDIAAGLSRVVIELVR